MNDFGFVMPTEFAAHMKELLREEYALLEEALGSKRSFGFRFNPLKTDADSFDKIKELLGATDKVEWCDEGFYYNETARPGKSPYHEAGAIYIQEPSAMSVVTVLDPHPGERICDLCAAPGGKTTHIAGRLMNKGLLVSNEIVSDRARILSKNIERCGVANCVVTNEDPDGMVSRFSGFFHKIVVDAPCSGEGMFRKEDAAVAEWSPDNVRMCAERQKYILDRAEKLVMPGGALVYSTCTFEPAEDEEIIGEFLQSHTDWHLEHTGLEKMLSKGRPEWMSSRNDDLSKAVRVWPHISKGEGHFIAKLVRDGNYPIEPGSDDGDINNKCYVKDKKKEKTRNKAGKNNNNSLNAEEASDYVRKLIPNGCVRESLTRAEQLIRYADSVYLLPKGISENDLKGLKVVRPGLCIADICKDRYEPAHSLAMALHASDVAYKYSMTVEEALKYMRGETIVAQTDSYNNGSWVLMLVGDISLGWGKYVNGIIKNHYPKGLRRL